MRLSIFILSAAVAASLAACNQASDEKDSNAAAEAAAVKKPKPAYCFFKEKETKAWAAKADKAGKVTVTGTVYRSDSRYKAVLLPAVIEGTTATVSPTIVDNDTGYAAPDNWWQVKQTIPASVGVTSVNITCGARTLASLTVPRHK